MAKWEPAIDMEGCCGPYRPILALVMMDGQITRFNSKLNGGSS